MKYYIITDSTGIVKSTDTSAIDPVATEKRACSEMFATDAYGSIAKQIAKLKNILKTTKKKTGQYRRTESMIIDANMNIKRMFADHIAANTIYMPIAPGDGLTATEVDEVVFAECNDLIPRSRDGFLSFVNGEFSFTENKCGKYFYQDENDEWQSYICTDPMESIPEEWICVGDLTDEQKTEIRLQRETDEERSIRLYDEKFNEFLTRIFLESPEYRDYERGLK